MFVSGVTNANGNSKDISYLYHNVAPIYVAFALLEKAKVSGVQWQRIQVSAAGRKFY